MNSDLSHAADAIIAIIVAGLATPVNDSVVTRSDSESHLNNTRLQYVWDHAPHDAVRVVSARPDRSTCHWQFKLQKYSTPASQLEL